MHLKAHIRKCYKSDVKKYVDYWNKVLIEDPKLIYEISRDNSDIFNIYCFSKNCSNILMWSHYADSHKGICIGIKTIYEESSNLIEFEKVKDVDKIKVEKVIYISGNKKILPVDYQGITADLVEKSLITKSLDWEYEEEYRTILLNNMVDNQILKLKRVNIVQLIFGFKTPLSVISETLKVIKESDFINIAKIKAYQIQNDDNIIH